ncbi:hypothetical protein QJS04_geneDACA019334 [Acorus gramineus]|uniref:Uncharacterized protein n=1 Tax=Acorus gramineus TaxID=55184 RepID=A0AAV9AR40_ACOGR|nr:hypothetical protein QJS04_geneDACA019334 [Acorus gramineus]
MGANPSENVKNNEESPSVDTQGGEKLNKNCTGEGGVTSEYNSNGGEQKATEDSITESGEKATEDSTKDDEKATNAENASST